MKKMQISLTGIKADRSIITGQIDLPSQLLESLLIKELARYYQIPITEIEQITDIDMVTLIY